MQIRAAATSAGEVAVAAERLTFPVTPEHAGTTLAAFLRAHLPDYSWSQVRRLIETRRIQVAGELSLDAARRLSEGQIVDLLPRSAPKPRQRDAICIRYVDHDVVVVEKPSGMSTVRHPAERNWSERRKALAPALEDLVPVLIARQERRRPGRASPRLRVVHRLDKETSGLVVFARTVAAERGLGRQFHRHTITRRYVAVVPGSMAAQRIVTRLVRDRGDGRRGSTALPGVGKEAVTNIEVVEKLRGHTLLSCQLETGRTHQIRIHLAEHGHPVCGEKVYQRKPNGQLIEHQCLAPRLALQAAELGFVHPKTGKAMHWEATLPPDLERFIDSLRIKRAQPGKRAKHKRANQVD